MSWAAFGIFILCFVGGFWIGFVITVIANWIYRPTLKDYYAYYQLYSSVRDNHKEEDKQ